MMIEQQTREVFKGKIIALHGSYMSGLATIFIDDEDRGTKIIHCENGATVRALEGAFGDVIGDAHNIKEEGGHVGKEIYYSVDFMDILDGFTPVEEASPELIRAYEKTKERV